jgi:hypothetical protein
MTPLPPKRFQGINDAKYDLIRFRGWFRSLEKRRAQIPRLDAALDLVSNGLKTQQAAAEAYSVDERELRDYTRFKQGSPVDKGSQRATYQLVLDKAYEYYAADKAKYHIREYIKKIAKLHGLKARHVVELWEVDPTFYPSGYKP